MSRFLQDFYFDINLIVFFSCSLCSLVFKVCAKFFYIVNHFISILVLVYICIPVFQFSIWFVRIKCWFAILSSLVLTSVLFVNKYTVLIDPRINSLPDTTIKFFDQCIKFSSQIQKHIKQFKPYTLIKMAKQLHLLYQGYVSCYVCVFCSCFLRSRF